MKQLRSPTSAHRFRPALEMLEDRTVPTTLAAKLSVGGLIAEPVQIVGGKPAVSVLTSQSPQLALQNGLAPQYMVALANELDADPWLTMPHVAADDYVRTFGTQVRNTMEPGRLVHAEWQMVSVVDVHVAAIVAKPG